MKMKTILERAFDFACNAHAGQLRKYTKEPYITHPVAVAGIVAGVVDDNEVIAAALLHDVVEDTDINIKDIAENFGHLIAILVENLTDISKPEDGKRKVRKVKDLLHTSQALPAAKTIKLADLIHNTESICNFDPEFAKIYMNEKRALLGVLKEGDKCLYAQAKKIVDDYFLDNESKV
jgi:(p)ppGpp synthase/HD superfamily hydrolase